MIYWYHINKKIKHNYHQSTPLLNLCNFLDDQVQLLKTFLLFGTRQFSLLPFQFFSTLHATVFLARHSNEKLLSYRTTVVTRIKFLSKISPNVVRIWYSHVGLQMLFLLSTKANDSSLPAGSFWKNYAFLHCERISFSSDLMLHHTPPITSPTRWHKNGAVVGRFFSPLFSLWNFNTSIF